jgi:periplasmic divalent cation tolerance protein
MIIIYSAFPNKKEAKKIGELLIKNKIVGCVNIFPIASIYLWQRKIVKDKEYGVFMKTQKANFKKVKKFIIKHHSYTAPCILEIPVGRVAEKYLEWLNNNVE